MTLDEAKTLSTGTWLRVKYPSCGAARPENTGGDRSLRAGDYVRFSAISGSIIFIQHRDGSQYVETNSVEVV